MSKKKRVVRDIYRVAFYLLTGAWVLWTVWLLTLMLPDIIDGILTDPIPFYVILGLLAAFGIYRIGIWAFSPDAPTPPKEDYDEEIK